MAKLSEKGMNVFCGQELADANFFWDEDKKISLHERVKDLESLVFHEDIGSYLNREERIGEMAHFIAEMLNFSPDKLELVKLASSLCKN